MAGQGLNDGNLYFFHQICGQDYYEVGPTFDIFSYSQRNYVDLQYKQNKRLNQV
jgi:hypothetical protein